MTRQDFPFKRKLYLGWRSYISQPDSDNHIQNVIVKVNRILAFIRRNIRTKHKGIRETAYNSLVTYQVEYASPVWSPYTNINGPRQANLVLLPMRAAKVQASLRIRAVSPEPPLLAHTSNESRGTFIQKARSLAPPNGWACAVKIFHDGMLEDTNSLDAAQIRLKKYQEEQQDGSLMTTPHSVV